MAVANGFIYFAGGKANSGYSTQVAAAKINPDGTTNPAIGTTALLTGTAYAGGGVSNGYLYVIGGELSGGTVSTNVYYAQIQSNGTVGSWANNFWNLSNNAGVSGKAAPAVVFSNGYAYVLGGSQSTPTVSPGTASIFRALTQRVQMATTLDLLGLTDSSQASASAGLGGSIYAGSIFSNDTLSIAGNSQLWGGASVTNGLTADNLFLSGTLNGTSPVASIAANTSFAGLVVDNIGTGDIFTASKSGATKFTITNAGNVVLANNNAIQFKDTGGNPLTALTYTTSNNVQLYNARTSGNLQLGINNIGNTTGI